MVRHGVELIMARRQIDALIKADPAEVIFTRKTKIKTPDGGWRWSPPAPLPPQEVCFIPFKRRMTEFLKNTELGDVPDLPYILLGRYDLDIEPNDVFTYLGDKYQVITIDMAEPEIKTAAHVDYFGGGTNG